MTLKALICVCAFLTGAKATAEPIYVMPHHIQQTSRQDVRVTFSYFTESQIISEGRPRFESDDKEFTAEIRQLIGKIVVYSRRIGERLVESDELEDFGLFVANYALKILNHSLEKLDFEDEVVVAMEFKVEKVSNRAFLKFEMNSGGTISHFIDLVEQKRIFKLWFSPIKSLNRTLYRQTGLMD